MGAEAVTVLNRAARVNHMEKMRCGRLDEDGAVTKQVLGGRAARRGSSQGAGPKVAHACCVGAPSRPRGGQGVNYSRTGVGDVRRRR